MHSQYQPFSQWFEPVKLTSSGRPELIPDEVELATSTKTNVYDGDNKFIEDELALLTSRRLIVLSHRDPSKNFAYPLINCRTTGVEKPWFKTPRIIFHFRDNAGDGKFTTPQEVDASFYPVNVQPTQPRECFKIGIKDGKTFDSFMVHIERARSDVITDWKQRLVTKQQETTVDYGTNEHERVRNVGIAGILKQREDKQKQTEHQLNDAGADLDSLMASAQQVTVILEKLSQRAMAQQKRQEEKEQRKAAALSPGGSDGTTPEDSMSQADHQDLTHVLEQMNYISPVTKQSSGNRWHEELSRQLFDFAQRPIELSHGNLSLVDLYCLYNRARGTELVSPQDVLKACQLWEKLFPANANNNQNSNRVTLRLKQLKSGGYIVQSSLYNENSERLRMHQYIYSRNCGLSGKGAAPLPSDVPDLWKSTQGKGVSALEISQFFKISVQLANEQLDVLVKDDRIVVDNSTHSIFYYHNFFQTNELTFN